MRLFQKFQQFWLMVLLCSTACTSAVPTARTRWEGLMMRLSQRQAFSLLAKIHAAPQPAAAKELLAPAIRLLIQGKLYKEAQHLAGTAINTFPKDSLYHQLLGEAYQAAIAAGYSSSRTEKKMQREFELAHQLHINMP